MDFLVFFFDCRVFYNETSNEKIFSWEEFYPSEEERNQFLYFSIVLYNELNLRLFSVINLDIDHRYATDFFDGVFSFSSSHRWQFLVVYDDMFHDIQCHFVHVVKIFLWISRD